MGRILYQLKKNNEPIALGSMKHCLDVFYWEIHLGNNHLEYDITSFEKQVDFLEMLSKKAQAYDLIKDDLEINEKEFRKQSEYDEISAIIHSHYVQLLEQLEI